MQVLRDRLATRLRPRRVVDNLLGVNGFAERTPDRGRAQPLTVSLVGVGSFETICGTAVRSLVLGQTILVRGCVLVRRGSTILAISRLSPGSQRRP